MQPFPPLSPGMFSKEHTEKDALQSVCSPALEECFAVLPGIGFEYRKSLSPTQAGLLTSIIAPPLFPDVSSDAADSLPNTVTASLRILTGFPFHRPRFPIFIGNGRHLNRVKPF